MCTLRKVHVIPPYTLFFIFPFTVIYIIFPFSPPIKNKVETKKIIIIIMTDEFIYEWRSSTSPYHIKYCIKLFLWMKALEQCATSYDQVYFSG